jgi:hypothetical protein
MVAQLLRIQPDIHLTTANHVESQEQVDIAVKDTEDVIAVGGRDNTPEGRLPER